MTSATMVLAPIMAALVKTEEILGPDRIWQPQHQGQQHFLERYFSRRKQLSVFTEKELRNWVSWVAAELNALLAEEGFSITLEPFKENEFGVVSILDVLVEWIAEGKISSLYSNNATYPAVSMERYADVSGTMIPTFGAYKSSQHPHPIAVVYTKNLDKVYMTIADQGLSQFELATRVNTIKGSMDTTHSLYYDELLFPMVDLDQEVSLAWLLNMETTSDEGDRAYISQAAQQTKFKMNEKGARVKSAVAIAVNLECAFVNRVLTIDQPFFLWIERKGTDIPVLSAYINRENWKNPGNLDM